MSAQHPTPWTVERGSGGRTCPPANDFEIRDARGRVVADHLGEETANEVVFAVNLVSEVRIGVPIDFEAANLSTKRLNLDPIGSTLPVTR